MKLVNKFINNLIRIIVMTVTIITICLMTACQPTPKNEIVVSKNDGNIEEIIKTTCDEEAEFVQTDLWTERYEKNNVVVNIDANINYPKVTRVPIYSVSPVLMSQSHVDTALDVLFNGATPYEDIELTKEKIEAIILENTLIMEEIQSGECPDCEEGDYEYFEQQNEQLKKLYNDAPYDNELFTEAADTTFYTDQNGTGLISFLAELDSSKITKLTVSNEVDLKIASLQFYNYTSDVKKVIHDVPYDGIQPNGVSMTLEDAIKLADKMVQEMGIEDIEITEIKTVNLYDRSIEGEMGAAERQAFGFCYSKVYNDITVYNYIPSMNPKDSTNEKDTYSDQQYQEVLSPEELIIEIDDSGVVFIFWFNPLMKIDVISENVKILDFEKIQEIFENQILYHQTYMGSNGILNINIDTISFGYFIQPIKDSPDEYRTIPVWDFVGKAQVNDKYKFGGNVRSFLTINAIDGSIINRKSGY